MEEAFKIADYLDIRDELYQHKDKANSFIQFCAEHEYLKYEVSELVKKNLHLDSDYLLEIGLISNYCVAGKISLAKEVLSRLVDRLEKAKLFQRIIDLEFYLMKFDLVLSLAVCTEKSRYMYGLIDQCENQESYVTVTEMTLNPHHFLKYDSDFTSLFELYQLIEKIDFLKAFMRAAPYYRLTESHKPFLTQIALDLESDSLRNNLGVSGNELPDKEVIVKEVQEKLSSIDHVIKINSDANKTIFRSEKLWEIAKLREDIFSDFVTKDVLINSLYEMGRIYEELDEKELAKKLYVKVLGLDENFRRVKVRLLEIDKN